MEGLEFYLVTLKKRLMR